MKKFLKKALKNYPLIILFLWVFGFGVFVGQNWQVKHEGFNISISSKETPKNLDVDFSLFWNVWDRVSKDYIYRDKVDPQKLLYGAISGMVAAIGDPYTIFLDPETNKEFETNLSGVYEGVGIQIGFRNKKLVVIAPLEGTPAKKAGVRAGDQIIKIGDKDAFDLTLPEAVKLIRGEAGTEVKITFARKDKRDFGLTLKRARIEVKSVTWEKKDDIAIIKLTRFSDTTEREWENVISEISPSGIKKIILDLRNNPGGHLSGAVDITGEFVKAGTTIVSQEDANGNRVPLKSRRDGVLTGYKVVVLINKGSASASEIVAGALRDILGVKLVGETSFGKGSVQERENLPSGSGLHITKSKWLTPNGTWVNDTGLEPDLKVELTEKDEEAGLDPQQAKALELLK